jgi:hypothetical protein
MKVMSMSESRANYAATLDSVINDHEAENLYLLASPANRER